jgi:hypothetical protein
MLAVAADQVRHTEASSERAWWRHVARCLFAARTLDEWEALVMGEEWPP